MRPDTSSDSVPAPTKGWHRATLATLLGVAAIIWLAATLVDRGERRIHLELQCDDRQCSATVDGGEPFEFEMDYNRRGKLLGLYVYHPHEFDRPQYFRDLRVEVEPGTGAAIEHPLTDGEWNGIGWSGDPGFQRSGRGLSHRGSLGERALTLLQQVEARDFRLELDLIDSIDAGLLFRAEDADNGTLLALRTRYNDILVFPLEAGAPGPILALVPLRTLGTWRELLRLAGLAAEILLLTALVLGIWRLILRFFPSREETAVADPTVSATPRGSAVLPWLVGFGVATFVALVAIALLGLGGVPHVADETAYLFQAKIFAGGALWASPPALPDFFLHEHIIITPGRWFGKYPPLFPALLALGVLAGAPWLVNPILGTLTGLAVFALGRELAGVRTGLVAWALMATSPFFLIMGATLMSHVACALFVTLFLWQWIRAVRRGSSFAASLAGIALGLALWTRPFTAFLAALAGAAYLVVSLRDPALRRRQIIAAGVLTALVLPLAGGFLLWNGWLAGDAGSGLQLYSLYDRTDTLGFGPDKGADWLKTWGSWGHTPAKAFRSAHLYLDYTSRHLLGWPARLSLALVLVPFLAGRARRESWLLLGCLFALGAGHMAYWATQHIGYGARYWFAALPGLMVLAAIGLRKLTVDGRRRPGLAVAAIASGLVLCNLGLYLPERLRELPEYGGVSARLKREIDQRPLGPALVFVETEGLLYNDGFYLNDPFFDEQIFARDLGDRNAELIELFPTHAPYRWSEERLTPIARAARSAAP